MSSTIQHLNQNKTRIHRNRVFEIDPEKLYSSSDLEQITEWNERVASGDVSEPPVSTSYELYREWYTFGRTWKMCLSELYCVIQYGIAVMKNEDPSRMGIYNVSTIHEWFPDIKDRETIRKYLDMLVEIGLLRQLPNNTYRKADKSLGPIFQTLAREGHEHVDDTVFEDFPEQPSRSILQPQQATPLSISTLKWYFSNEHIVGWLLLTYIVGLMVKLLIGVALTGTVTTIDIVFAGVVTWLGLIGLIALCIGLLRRRYDGIVSLHRYRTM